MKVLNSILTKIRVNNKSKAGDEIIEWLRTNGLDEAFSDFIKRPDAFTRITSGILGWTWEHDFKKLCDLNGLSCKLHNELNSSYDAIVNGHVRVQCKHTSAFPRVDIRNKDKTTKRRYKFGSFDVLALRSLDSVYIIPQYAIGADMVNGNDCIVPSINLNNFEYYKNNWNIIRYKDCSIDAT